MIILKKLIQNNLIILTTFLLTFFLIYTLSHDREYPMGSYARAGWTCEPIPEPGPVCECSGSGCCADYLSCSGCLCDVLDVSCAPKSLPPVEPITTTSVTQTTLPPEPTTTLPPVTETTIPQEPSLNCQNLCEWTGCGASQCAHIGEGKWFGGPNCPTECQICEKCGACEGCLGWEAVGCNLGNCLPGQMLSRRVGCPDCAETSCHDEPACQSDACAGCGEWDYLGICGSECPPNEIQAKRHCPSGCDLIEACVPSSSCQSTGCVCTDWISTGTQGGCSYGHIKETRYCVNNCDIETRCVFEETTPETTTTVKTPETTTTVKTPETTTTVGCPQDKLLYKRLCKSYTADEWNTRYHRHPVCSGCKLGSTYYACQPDDSDTACCPDNNCVYNGNCYSADTRLDVDNDGFEEVCVAGSNGEWVEVGCESDFDCAHYEYCDTTGAKTGVPYTCYDFRPEMLGCNYYDYCTDGKDPDDPGIDCSSNWDIYCYTADADQVDTIRNACVDTSYVDHWYRTCPAA